MATLELKSQKREILGKKVKTLRNKGLIPAVVYPVRSQSPEMTADAQVHPVRNEVSNGMGRTSNGVYGGKNSSLPITVGLKEFNKILKMVGETTLVRLLVDDKAKNVLIYDVLRDPTTDQVNHVDFYEVKMDEKIIKKVPLNFIGSSPAVDDLGGILVKAMQELEVRALPSDLPHEIQVDISGLKTFEDNVLVKDINLPKNVEALENIETSVASVIPPRSEAEIEALSGAVEEKVEEIKVETEEKVKERQKEENQKPEA